MVFSRNNGDINYINPYLDLYSRYLHTITIDGFTEIN